MFKIIVVLLVVGLLSSVYFWQGRKVSDEQNYINKEWNFSLNLPEGYLVSGEDTLLYIVKKPTADDETPAPDMRIKIEQGNKTTIDPDGDLKAVSQEEVTINNVKGHKTVVSYKSYPEGSECPVYRLHHEGVVYELSLYECLESPIFESVVQSFKII